MYQNSQIKSKEKWLHELEFKQAQLAPSKLFLENKICCLFVIPPR